MPDEAPVTTATRNAYPQTRNVSVALALRPAASTTVAVTVCLPFVSLAVCQATA